MGYLNGKAHYLSACMPPAYDFWTTAIVVTEEELEEFMRTLKIRTKIVGRENQIIALIIANRHLQNRVVHYDSTTTFNRLVLQ